MYSRGLPASPSSCLNFHQEAWRLGSGYDRGGGGAGGLFFSSIAPGEPSGVTSLEGEGELNAVVAGHPVEFVALISPPSSPQ